MKRLFSFAIGFALIFSNILGQTSLTSADIAAYEESPQKRLESFICSYFTENEKHIVARPLWGSGALSQLYHLQVDQEEYLLRFDLEKSLPQEYYMLNLASNMGISPHVYYMDCNTGVALMAYINDTQTIRLEQAQSAITSIAHTLQKIHQIPKAPFPTMQLIDCIRRDYRALENRGITEDNHTKIMEQAEKLHLQLESKRYPRSMIHGDAHGKNIFLLQDSSILFIDWFDARYDDPYFDLAYSVCTLNLNRKQEDEYLSAYLGQKATEEEWQHYLVCKELTLLAFYFKLLALAYTSCDLGAIDEPAHCFQWYIERFMENSTQSSSEYLHKCSKTFLKNWAEAARTYKQ